MIAENFEINLSLDHPITNALLKHDLATGKVEVHEFGAGCTAGEAVFVPSAPEAGEEDGYVMALVHDPDRGAADLVILAAQDFTANPAARSTSPPGSRSAFTATGYLTRPPRSRHQDEGPDSSNFRTRGSSSVESAEGGLRLQTHTVGDADPD